jgi:hypothetical protein
MERGPKNKHTKRWEDGKTISSEVSSKSAEKIGGKRCKLMN